MQIPSLSNLFSRTSRDAGWFAICVSKGGIYLTAVKWPMSNRPQVLACSFHAVPDVTPAALEKICKDAHVGRHQFTTLLAPGEYQMLVVDAPNVPVDELKTAIRWRIKDALSYHIDDATVDVLQIPSSKYGAERPQSMYAVAASNATIQKRIALFDNAKIELKVIDIPEMAQRNIAALFEQDGRGLALLAFDEDNGGLLTFTAGGELYLARRIEISVGQLLDANQSLRQQYRDRVVLEVQRSLDYFGRQFHHLPVGQLLVSVPADTNLEKELADNLDLQVEVLDLAQAMDISAVPDLARRDYVAHVLHPLGAALRLERRAL